ncbi:MAG: hypothetical protein AUK17_00570 [Parcubacteria group bacterium CG2_30_44_18]|nr:MAG: hypothetical protein AUK17_00570 [Parcubacteria group bacterium CG2_30_44_18]
MKQKFELLQFINQLVACEPRLGKNLIKTEKLITKTLKSNGLSYGRQPFTVADTPELAKEYKIKVPLEKHRTSNLLVGNLSKPKSILLTHFDAIGPGALDNASGVAVCLKILVENPDFIKNNLIVFSGSEETSPEKPIYWGYGYRVFEEKYGRLLKNCRAIYVVDCVGDAKLHFFQGDYYFHEAVPLKNLAAVKQKLFVLTGSVKYLLAVCHTRKDTIAGLSQKYLEASYNQLVKACYRI